ncbi:CHASE domain-containing protein [Azospirillum sp. TSO22-1]|uniref:CHASE domain-containing protein n=1 Tax=Azospirillum sp. TSO22-1 TaxID=716789 RepID=UPI000D6516C0|nr:CHASE domain-containing protein [Azospirillum sp. TSO22-1]
MVAPLPDPPYGDHRPPSWEAALALILGLSLAALAAWLLYQQADRQADARFRAQAHDLAAAIVERMENYEQILRGGVALMDAGGALVTRATWRTYVASLNVEERYPGIQGIGFAERVAPAEIAAHEITVRGEGFPDYRVQPDTPRDAYFPVVYLEPFSGRNLRAFGYDMFSEPVRRAAMERARDTGRTAASGRVRLVQETGVDEQAGFLIYLPVYDRALPLESVGDRRRAIRGFVYSPFRMSDLMDPLMTGQWQDYLDVHIHDGATADSATLLYDAPAEEAGTRQLVTAVDVFGRSWTVDVRATPGFEASVDQRAPVTVLVAGFLISVLLVAVTRSLLAERDRTAELRRIYDEAARARAEAEYANAAKSRFLAAASHDLRQPMQTLGIYLHLISEHAAAASMRRLVDGARAGFEAAQRMLTALMDTAALETGAAKPALRPIDLDAFLDRIARELHVEAEAKGLELRVHLDRLSIDSDPAMLERIVRNLLHNALKYTASGCILLACRPRQGGAVIKVQDTGPGIPPERLHLIFEDFYQVDNPERDRNKGLGLGLATVARLTRLLGYRIGVRSRPGRGAVFTVEIPAAARTGAEAMPERRIA